MIFLLPQTTSSFDIRWFIQCQKNDLAVFGMQFIKKNILTTSTNMLSNISSVLTKRLLSALLLNLHDSMLFEKYNIVL